MIPPQLLMQFLPMLMGGGGGGGGMGGGGGGPSPFNMLPGAAMTVLGSYLGHKEQKKQKSRAMKRLNAALKSTEAFQGRALGQQEALSRLATQQQVGGYDAARREANRLGRADKQAILDRGVQTAASISQDLQNRNLSSTTRPGNLQRGVQADVGRGIGQINQNLAGLFGDLALGRAGAQAQGTQALSALAGQRGDLASQLAQMRALKGATLGNFQVPDYTGSVLGGAVSGLSGILGDFMGQRQAAQGQQQMMEMLQRLFGQG